MCGAIVGASHDAVVTAHQIVSRSRILVPFGFTATCCAGVRSIFSEAVHPAVVHGDVVGLDAGRTNRRCCGDGGICRGDSRSGCIQVAIEIGETGDDGIDVVGRFK